MSKFTEEFEIEIIYWLSKTAEARHDHLVQTINAMEADSKTNEDELGKAKDFLKVLSQFKTSFGDMISASDKQQLALVSQMKQFQEVIELNASERSVQLARECLQATTDAILNFKVKLTLDRSAIRFLLKIAEDDLKKFPAIISQYEKSKEEDHLDPMYTRDYWIAKSRKAKKTVEQFKKKLEKGL